MRTILSGRVTMADLADADFIAGITPTSFVTNGLSTPPTKAGLPCDVEPICPKLPDIGEQQRNYTLCLRADALIVKGENAHLVRIARQYGLPVYEA